MAEVASRERMSGDFRVTVNKHIDLSFSLNFVISVKRSHAPKTP